MSEFEDLLKRSGMNRAQLARRLALNVNTPYRWVSQAPGYAMAYLKLYVAIKEGLSA